METSIDPPPILDILITGRATDLRTLKNTTAKKPYAVSPEVFGAWFTGYGKRTRGYQLRGGRSDHQPQRRAQAVVRHACPNPGAVHPGHPQGQGPGTQEGRGQAGGNQEGRRTEEDRCPHEARESPRRAEASNRIVTGAPGSAGRRSIRAPICTRFSIRTGRSRSRTAKVPPWFRARALGPHLPDQSRIPSSFGRA